MFSRPAISPESSLDLRVVALISLLLSAWLIAIDPIVSRDAIIYLRAADAYLQQGFFASQELYGRPLLPLLIATAHQLTGLSLLHAGLLLNSLFYVLLCCGFVAAVRTMGGDYRTQVFAALVILAHPLLAEYRSSMLRDPAYWACMVLAFRELLLYMRDPRIRHQLGWFAAVVVATQFRFEGLFFALLVPPLLLLVPGPQSRLRSCLCLLVPQLVVVALLAIGVLSYQATNPEVRVFPGIGVYLDRLQDLGERYAQVVTQTGEVMLEFSAREDAALATTAGLLAILLLNLCRALGWSWVAVLAYGWWRGLTQRLASAERALLNAHLGIALLYLSLFLLINQFVLERYAGIFVVFAMLYLPFVLSPLWGGGSRVMRVATVAVLLYVGADTLHNNNYRKAFIEEAAQWLHEHGEPGSRLLTNSLHIAYVNSDKVDWQPGRQKPRGFVALSALLDDSRQLRRYDMLAIRVKTREQDDWQAFLQRKNLEETRVFEAGSYGRLAIVDLKGD